MTPRDVNANGNSRRTAASSGTSSVASLADRARDSAAAPTRQIGGLSLSVPPEWLEALAAAVAERLVADGSVGVSPWLDRPAAAEYLSVPLARLEKDRTVPCHRWEGRVLYHRAELDEWLLEMGPR